MDCSFLFVLLLVSCFAWAENGSHFGACELCDGITDALKGHENANTTKEALLKELGSISNDICSKIPSIPKEECISFITINGAYYVEEFTSGTKLDEICGNLGLCEGTSPEKIIFPTMKNDSVDYTISESNYGEKTEFKYKIFLGDIPFLDNQTYALSSVIDPISASQIMMQIVIGDEIFLTKRCFDKIRCNGNILRPGKGIWVHIKLMVTSVGENSSFTLTLSEHNSVGHWEYAGSQYYFVRFVVLLLLGLLALCFVCFAMTRCIFYFFGKNPREYYYKVLNGDTRQPLMFFLDDPSMNIPYSYAGNPYSVSVAE